MNKYNLYPHQILLGDKISDYSRPLSELGICFFSYTRIYKDHTFLMLCNQEEWYRIKGEKKLYDFNGFVPTLNLHPRLFTRLLFTGQPDKNIRVFTALYEAGFWNMIGYYSYTDDFIESVRFGAKINNHYVINHYINCSEFFEKFIYGFRYCFAETIDSPSPNLLLPLNDTYQAPKPESLKLPCLPLLNDSLPITYRQKKFLLSNRQAQCLANIARGATAKETAQALHLSYRTIQYYLRNLKKKFDTQNLSEVLQSLSHQEISYLLFHTESL